MPLRLSQQIPANSLSTPEHSNHITQQTSKSSVVIRKAIKMNFLALFILLCGRIAYPADSFFEPECVNPIVWAETRKVVAPVPFDYYFLYHVGGPCPKLLEMVRFSPEGIKKAYQHCESVYNYQILKCLTKMTKKSATHVIPLTILQNNVKRSNDHIFKKDKFL